MCGITGYKLFNSSKDSYRHYLSTAVGNLQKRGPDYCSSVEIGNIGLGHTRLSIIDTSEKGHQPMSDPSGRYTLIFNGEIYNYKELEKSISGVDLRSTSDTEVLLYLLIKEGANCLEHLNGFFSLAFYDKQTDTLLLTRDRMGIKPLIYFLDEKQLVFASEMKAILSFPIHPKLNFDSLYWYLKLNYLPGDMSMVEGVRKLAPGHYLQIKGRNVEAGKFHEFAEDTSHYSSLQKAETQLTGLLNDSVARRLISDVPLGSFLSGGIDSSAIVALASRHHPNLKTFSIGYRDHSFFDETRYAELVAQKFNTDHTTFSLTNDDLLNDLDAVLDYIDEPFADSSALPTYILSKHTAKHVKVALSGDGADELFGGYYKHLALNTSLQRSFANSLVKACSPIFKKLPQSRSTKIGNSVRRLNRLGTMLSMDSQERYWFLASLTNDPSTLLQSSIDELAVSRIKRNFLRKASSMNDYLDADIKMLLPSDMLTKVDLMSMANSLEVRVPFLDKNVVEFARSLPISFKINGTHRKRILQNAFKEILPAELYNRPKKGFEVPLLHWMRNELKSDLEATVFNREFLEEQGIFEVQNILNLRKVLLSSNPGDVHAILWALYIFQKWSNKYLNK